MIVSALMLPIMALGSTADSDKIEVGSNKGRFKTNSSGNALYSIKILTPPGIQKYTPKLSFGYNSANQNGLLGMGWSLNGFSKISRVSKIIAVDGVDGAVTYTNNDRFTLNGKRLLVMEGDYGSNGSRYRTEIDNWQKISASGVSGTGPSSFTVLQPNGETMVFGGTDDSRVLVPGSTTVREWLISSQTDRNGNLISYTYSLDPMGTGRDGTQAYPVEISYGANPSADATLQPNRFIKMTYETRLDPILYYKAGTGVETDLILSSVNTYLGSALVSNYRLIYEAALSPSTAQSRLQAIQRFASTSENAVGLSPSSFKYQDSDNAYDGGGTWLNGYFTPSEGWDPVENPVELADVNGDGLVDIIGFKEGVQVSLATDDGSFESPTTWLNDFSPEYNWTSDQPRYLADVNGDGLADIVGFSDEGVQFAYANPTGGNFIKSNQTYNGFAPNNDWQGGGPRYLADANGDGLIDIVGFGASGVEVALATGSISTGFGPKTPWNNGYGLSEGWESDNLLLADVNGDGKSDVVAMDQTTQTVSVALSTGSSFSQEGWNQNYANFADSAEWGADNPRMLSDVNGDGLADLVGFSTEVQVGLSNGAGFEAPTTWSSNFAAPNWTQETPRMITDVNGDGRADIVGFNDGGVQIAVSNGSAFVDNNWDQNSLNRLGLSEGGSAKETQRMIVDVNADGMLDVIAFTQNDVQVGLVSGLYPDLAHQIERSSKGVVEITYKPISDPSVYSEPSISGALAKFQRYRPLVQNPTLPNYRARSRLTGRFYVVSNTVNKNNPAITEDPYEYEVIHTYQNAEVSNTGRGWLGYGAASYVNVSMGRKTALTYHQDFPKIGRPSSRQVTCSGTNASACQAEDKYHYDHFDYKVSTTETNSQTGLSATMVRPKSVQSDIYQGSEYQHSIGQVFTYDEYGNRTQNAKLNLVSQAGKDSDPIDNVYVTTSYQNDPTNWRYGFKSYQKTSRSPLATGLNKFIPKDDLKLRHWTYDGSMNTLSSETWDQENESYLSTQYTYGLFGHKMTITKPNGATTHVTYEPDYNTYPQVVTKPAVNGINLVTNYGFDARFGKKSLRIDPNGNHFTTCYDRFSRRHQIQGPAPEHLELSQRSDACIADYVTAPSGMGSVKVIPTSLFRHQWVNGVPTIVRTNLNSWPEVGKPPTTQSTTNSYDGLEREYQSLTEAEEGGPMNRVLKKAQFNAMNKPEQIALPHHKDSPDIQHSNTVYDALNRVLQVTAPWKSEDGILDVPTNYDYDVTPSGVTVTQTLAADTDYQAERTVTRNYRANKKQITSTSFQDDSAPSNPTIELFFKRDVLGRVTEVEPQSTDNSTKAKYKYDSVGRISRKDLPSLGRTRLEYGPDGFLAERTQEIGTTSYEYDALGRKTNIIYPKEIRVALTYDDTDPGANGLGRLKSATVTGQASNVVRTYKYDSYGNVNNSSLQVGNPLQTLSASSHYDPLGRSVKITLPDRTELTNDYRLEHLVQQSVNGEVKITYGEFTPLGQPKVMKYANGIKTRIEYAPDFNITNLRASNDNGLLWKEKYQLDPFGYPLTVNGASTQWPTYIKTAGYESLRLSTTNDDRLPQASNSFHYDGDGNLLKDAQLNLVADGYQLTSGSKINGEPLGASYDEMGNLTATTASSLSFQGSYDGRNRLKTASINPGGAQAEFVYDHLGVRVFRQDLSGNSHIYHSPFYKQSSGPGNSAYETVLRSSLGPAYISNSGTGGQETFLHGDARHSLTFTSVLEGKTQDWFLYDAYGTPINRSASAPEYGFMGKIYDADTGLYYFNQRYYQPQLARFTRPDTRYGASIYRHDSANRYAFLLNNPAWGFDPTGHGLPSCVIGIGGTLTGLAGGATTVVNGQDSGNGYTISSGSVGIGAGLLSAGGAISACLKFYRKRQANNEGAEEEIYHDPDSDDGVEGEEIDEQSQHSDSDDSSQDEQENESENDSDGEQDNQQENEPDSDDSSDSDQEQEAESDSEEGDFSSEAENSEDIADSASESEIGSSSVSEVDAASVTLSETGTEGVAATTSVSTAVTEGEGAGTGIIASTSATTATGTTEIATSSAANVTGIVADSASEAVAAVGEAVAATIDELAILLPLIFL
tara:strand:+ start:5448 stop:11741 length:6294 start_codon:yes stop_codon:yes gene_type:complete